MGTTARIFFVDENDKVIKVPYSRWDRVRFQDPKESFPEFKEESRDVVTEMDLFRTPIKMPLIMAMRSGGMKRGATISCNMPCI